MPLRTCPLYGAKDRCGLVDRYTVSGRSIDKIKPGDYACRRRPQGGSGRGIPTLLDLGADKCVPCKMMAPILVELRETYAGRLKVDFIDVWKDPVPGREYGIRVIPTQIFFDEQGNELFRHQGFMSRDDILTKWAELGYEFDA